MTPSIIDFVKSKTSHIESFGNVLEVGSYNVNGSVRDVIKPRSNSYLGVDIVEGPGVDRVVADLEELLNEEGRFDTIACCETLEHTLNPIRMVEQTRMLLKPGGLLLITTPTFHFPLHRYPIDCYRFGEDAYRLVFFKGMEVLSLEHVKDNYGYDIICCLGVLN